MFLKVILLLEIRSVKKLWQQTHKLTKYFSLSNILTIICEPLIFIQRFP